MEFTGERYVPSVNGQVKYEHLHRYALALEFAAGKTVLDIASGEGYGSAILASVARFVTGVDADPAAVAHATLTYRRPNLSFAVGACEATPLANASFDLITSFETIEHHDKHEEMLSEIKRLLRPDGVLIISSPNKLVYSDQPGYANPFHVKELYYEEFLALLRRHFQNVRFYGQRLASGSFVHPLVKAHGNVWNAWSGNVDHLVPEVVALKAPVYFIAICSDVAKPQTREVASVYLSRSDDLTPQEPASSQALRQAGRNERSVDDLTTDLMRAKAGELRANVIAQANHAHVFRQSIGMVKARARYANAMREQQERIYRLSEILDREAYRSNTTSSQVDSYRERMLDMQAQLARQGDALMWIYGSRRWRITSILGRLGEWRDKIRRSLNKTVFRGVLDLPQLNNSVSSELQIEGWAYSTAAPVTLVQVFVDDMFFGNIRYGVERPDVAAAFPREAPLTSGYRERISFQGLNLDGKRLLTIKAHDAKGNTETYTRQIIVDSTATDTSIGQGEKLWIGLNKPRAGDTVADEVSISGWAYSCAAPITQVEILVGKFLLGRLTYGAPRPDVLTVFPEAPLECGFQGNFPLTGLAHGEQELTIRATDAKGNVRTFTRLVTIPRYQSNCIRGTLDFPQEGPVNADVIEIVGWAYSTAGSISTVEAWIDELYLGSLQYGDPRLDVVTGYPEAPIACGFKEHLSMSSLSLHGQKELRVVVYDEHGNEATFCRSIALNRPTPRAFHTPSDPELGQISSPSA